MRSSLASNGGGEVGAEHPENYKVKSFGFKKQEDRKKEERIKKEDEAFKEERKLNEGKKTRCQIDCQVMDTHLLDYPGAWRTDDGSFSSSSSSLPGRQEAAASEILSDTGLCRPGAPSTRRSLPPYFNFKS